jgi:hypothetical protein
MSTVLSPKAKSKSYISALETYARQEDGRNFQKLTEQINWEAHPPAVLKRAIDLALSMELTRLAMDLAQKGGTLFPFDEEMQNAAKVLRPPIVRVIDRPPSYVDSSLEWITAHAAEYKGKWIAVRDNELLAVAPTLKELAARTTLGTDTLVTKVL